MGEDNLLSFHKWKNYEIILQYHDIYVYPRPKQDGKCLDPVILNKTHWVAAPLIEISSSFIRAAIASGKNIKYFMPHSSFVYLQEMNFFKQAKSS
jgi:nicotinate-nucleotide adenylyltransferase